MLILLVEIICTVHWTMSTYMERNVLTIFRFSIQYTVVYVCMYRLYNEYSHNI